MIYLKNLNTLNGDSRRGNSPLKSGRAPFSIKKISLALFALGLSMATIEGAHAQENPSRATAGNVKKSSPTSAPKKVEGNTAAKKAATQKPAVSVGAEEDESFDDEEVSPNESESSASAAPRKQPKFNIWEYDVHGAKAIASEKIEEALEPFLGPDKSFDDVQKASQALEKLYRDSGYPVVSVEIPEQDVVGGRVDIKVTEGIVNNIRVLDSRYFLLSDIKKRVPSLQKGESLYVPELQQDLNKLNSLSSDLRVVPVLKEGEQPGTVDVDLKVKDKMPLHGEVEYNNYASANTSDTRLSASIGYENLWQKYHSFSMQMQITPEATDEIRVLSGTYLLPVGDALSRLAIYGVSSDSKIDTLTSTSNGLQVKGNSKIAGFRYVNPMSVSAEFQHAVTLGFDYKDVLEEVVFTDNPKQEGLLTPVTFGVWAAEYKATWRKPTSLTQLGGGVYFGVTNVFNETKEFADKRYNGQPNFIYWKASAQRKTDLPWDLALVNKVKLQYTDSPLISNEQLAIGGNSTVRGYFESQAIGDRGIMSSIELVSPRLLKKYQYLGNATFTLFYDTAIVETLSPLKDQKNSLSLSSAGIGFEFTSFTNLHANVDWSYPLQNVCNGECGASLSDVKRGDGRATFQLTYQY